jgi:type IV pilus assembly protein PilY1
MRAEKKRWVATVGWALGLSALVGCYDVRDRPSVGGESHFLRPCQEQAQCEDLGEQFSCRDGFCRMDEGEEEGDGPIVAATSPLVLMVVDTSGSMERLGECTCVTPGCEECLPDCTRNVRNRWAQTLEALTGTFDDFACERIPRDSFSLDRYDAGYYLPYYRPSGVQRDDGLLDRYGDRVRFGVATFDGWDTWIGAAPLVAADEFDFELSRHEQGLWSYNPAREIAGFAPDSEQPHGKFFYPNCTESYFMDTGIRSERAEAGGLQIAYDGRIANQVHGEIERSLLALRPYGGTPIAASLDDVYYLFTQDPRMVAERERGAPLHVVLLTDGYPDDDYRTFGCDCAATAKTVDDCGVGQDPAAMICPYPMPEDAAHALRCGRDSAACDTPLATLHVVGFAVDDAAVIARLHSIARAGGAEQARIAPSALALQQALDEVLASIAD